MGLLDFIIRLLGDPEETQEIQKGRQAVSSCPQQPAPAEQEKINYPFVNCGISRALDPVDFIVFDTETTGFTPGEDKIIELAAIKLRGGEVARFHSLVNPGRRIPQRARAVHGINDADVAGAPSFAQILPALDAFLDPDLPVVGHNVLFDLKFLWWEYHDAGQEIFPRRFIDTYKLAKKTLPGRQSYSLASLIHDYSLIEGEQAHRSESDVDATLALYELLRGEAGK